MKKSDKQPCGSRYAPREGSGVGMAKESSGRSRSRAAAPRKALSPEQIRFRRQVALNLTVFLLLAGSAAVGYSYLRTYVEHRLTFPVDPPRVVLKERPAWMTDFLAEQIVASVQPVTARSSFDQQMLVNAYEILRHNPWIKQVKQVRRAYGHGPGDTIEIDCDYRAPI